MNLRLHVSGPARDRFGLSLQEMLVVLAVFIVLVVILTISSNTVVVKSRLSRVKQEQQMISGALEAYRVEQQRYPSVLGKLVRPTGYLNEIPVDPFSKDNKTPYAYYCLSAGDPGAKGQAILVSAGPDGDIDFFPPVWAEMFSGPVGGSTEPGATSGLDPVLEAILLNTYDPTNGVASSGDVIKLTLD